MKTLTYAMQTGCTALAYLLLCTPQYAVAEVEFVHNYLVIDDEKVEHLVVRCSGANVRIELLERSNDVKVIVTEDQQQFSHEFGSDKIEHIELHVPNAKVASLDYQLGGGVTCLSFPRSIAYFGATGFDTVHINVDYNEAGQTVSLGESLLLDIHTYESRDHINVDVARIDVDGALALNTDLGDDDDFFRFWTRYGSEAAADTELTVQAGAGNDELFLEYHPLAEFRNGRTRVKLATGDPDSSNDVNKYDEVRWFSGAAILNSHEVMLLGDNGEDLLMTWLMGDCHANEDIMLGMFGDPGRDALGILIENNPTWPGLVLMDGGSANDEYFPELSEKYSSFNIQMLNVEYYDSDLMSEF